MNKYHSHYIKNLLIPCLVFSIITGVVSSLFVVAFKIASSYVVELSERLYEKVWKPSGDFSISAMYIDLYDYSEKVPYLEEHLSQIKKMARDI